MNKIKLLLVCFFTLTIVLFSLQNIEAQEIVFDNTYGFADYSAGRSIVQLPDSGYAFLGITGFAEGNSQLLFVRTDKNGVPLHFRQTADADKLYEGKMMRVAANGDYIIAGTLRDGTKPYSPFCMRVDSSFNSLWVSTIPTNGVSAMTVTTLWNCATPYRCLYQVLKKAESLATQSLSLHI